jgi:propanol-preferring alcohol dehydrogenase
MAETAFAEGCFQAADAGRDIQKQCGGADAAIVLTAAPLAIEQAFRSMKRTGKVVLVGIANTRFELPVIDTVLKGIHVQGSFLGTRQDLDDALRLAAEGRVKAHVETHPLERTPELLERLRHGNVKGRAVIVF